MSWKSTGTKAPKTLAKKNFFRVQKSEGWTSCVRDVDSTRSWFLCFSCRCVLSSRRSSCTTDTPKKPKVLFLARLSFPLPGFLAICELFFLSTKGDPDMTIIYTPLDFTTHRLLSSSDAQKFVCNEAQSLKIDSTDFFAITCPFAFSYFFRRRSCPVSENEDLLVPSPSLLFIFLRFPKPGPFKLSLYLDSKQLEFDIKGLTMCWLLRNWFLAEQSSFFSVTHSCNCDVLQCNFPIFVGTSAAPNDVPIGLPDADVCFLSTFFFRLFPFDEFFFPFSVLQRNAKEGFRQLSGSGSSRRNNFSLFTTAGSPWLSCGISSQRQVLKTTKKLSFSSRVVSSELTTVCILPDPIPIPDFGVRVPQLDESVRAYFTDKKITITPKEPEDICDMPGLVSFVVVFFTIPRGQAEVTCSNSLSCS